MSIDYTYLHCFVFKCVLLDEWCLFYNTHVKKERRNESKWRSATFWRVLYHSLITSYYLSISLLITYHFTVTFAVTILLFLTKLSEISRRASLANTPWLVADTRNTRSHTMRRCRSYYLYCRVMRLFERQTPNLTVGRTHLFFIRPSSVLSVGSHKTENNGDFSVLVNNR
jgi:hypothetical protein